jgi:hypothetical protein
VGACGISRPNKLEKKMAKSKSYDPSTKLTKCTCKHAFQDAEYGEDIRLMNKKKAGGFCCTVCGKDKV